MNENSILVCPNEKLLNPESIKAFAESNKDNWNLLLIDHHPDLKVKMNNVYQSYIGQKNAIANYKQYASAVKNVATQYEASPAIWATINDWLVELEWIVEDEIHDPPDYLYDQMMAFNTLISSLLVMAVIPQLIWVDARDFIRTNDEYGDPGIENEIDWDRFEKDKRYASQTFLGSTKENNSTTVTEADTKSFWLRGL